MNYKSSFFFILENQKSQEKNEAEQLELIPGEQSKSKSINLFRNE